MCSQYSHITVILNTSIPKYMASRQVSKYYFWQIYVFGFDNEKFDLK